MVSFKTLLMLSSTIVLAAAAPAPAPYSGPTTSEKAAGAAVASYAGDMTFYNPEGAAGKCGGFNVHTDAVAALSASQLSGVSACGKMIRIHRNGLSTTAKIVDLCPGCGSGSIDVTTTVFDKLAKESEGRVHVTWEFI